MASNTGFWWWSSNVGGAAAEFDRLLESCTSSNLPSSTPPPIIDSLALSDLIRSSAVSASHAIKSLQKRLDHFNPNVQLLAISVIDVCVKNGGDTFLKEIGSRPFSEDCAQLLTNLTTNPQVKEKLKRDFQNWALAFEAVPFLSSSELVTNYRRLKTLGIEFPPKDPSATAAMVDSMSAPDWRDSDVCERCRTAFSFTNRKHHCRNCGGVFDGACSSKKRSLPHFGVFESVRICDGCDRNLTAGISSSSKSQINSGRRNSFSGDASYPSSDKLSLNSTNHHRSATIHSGASSRLTNWYNQLNSDQSKQSTTHSRLSREEADLERAIALSLQDSAPSQPSHHLATAPSRPPIIEDEGSDPDLAAAIAASLRDVQPDANTLPSAPISTSPKSVRSCLPKSTLVSHDLNEDHANTLLNFSADVDTARRLGQLLPTNVELNNRHAQAELARPYLNKSLEHTDRKTHMLKDMNDKLSQAVKIYDRLLGEQIMYRTQPNIKPEPIVASTLNYHGQVPFTSASQLPSDPYRQQNPNQFFTPEHHQFLLSSQNQVMPYHLQSLPNLHNPTFMPQDKRNDIASNTHLPPFHPSHAYSHPSFQVPPNVDCVVSEQHQVAVSPSQMVPQNSTYVDANPSTSYPLAVSQQMSALTSHLPSFEAPKPIESIQAIHQTSTLNPSQISFSPLSPFQSNSNLNVESDHQVMTAQSSSLTYAASTVAPTVHNQPEALPRLHNLSYSSIPSKTLSDAEVDLVKTYAQDISSQVGAFTSNPNTFMHQPPVSAHFPKSCDVIGATAPPDLSKNVPQQFTQPVTLQSSSPMSNHPIPSDPGVLQTFNAQHLTSTIQTSSEPCNQLPTFPSVPQTAIGRLVSNHHRHWDQGGIEVQGRQEDVPPLIEL
ncbi:hypothetical protein O181_004091 [Austropuccinia psidii MF-1]|uniref:Vacuolar protein sorting-associated protein 27 n=1 Tax=Austropuccinia psidii MF-1 TaxID=1389203 RepID=A0A9Q3BG76_9BASI|nr:hypothetical protein [Austropuccinia psidii MF-1]